MLADSGGIVTANKLLNIEPVTGVQLRQRRDLDSSVCLQLTNGEVTVWFGLHTFHARSGGPQMIQHSFMSNGRTWLAEFVALGSLRQLNQIPAGIVQHCRGHRPHSDGWLRKVYPRGAQTCVFGMNIFHAEGSERDAILDESAFERWYCRVAVGFEQQFGAIPVIWRDDR